MNRYMKKFAVSMIATAGALAAGLAPSASAASTDSAASTSANWAGYVAKGSTSGQSPQFSSVSGSWVQPSADCSSGTGDAAFWVGLGGAGEGSGALEQVGTQIDCSTGGSGQHFAWYELVPAAPVRLDVAISPGDHVAARVSVAGTAVTVSLTDQSTGATATKTLEMNSPDSSSAEWIAEAPSECQGADASDTASCTPVPLADFGTVGFTGASATANGSTGTISSANWAAQAVQLSAASGSEMGDPGVAEQTANGASSAGAVPSSLSADGSSFSVAAQSDGSQSVASSGSPGDPGSSDGSSGGSGGDGGYAGDGGDYGGYGGYGSGGGDPYGGYGFGGGDGSGAVGY